MQYKASLCYILIVLRKPENQEARENVKTAFQLTPTGRSYFDVKRHFPEIVLCFIIVARENNKR
jgi:hypothetical protein